jgi:hypothetical protein
MAAPYNAPTGDFVTTSLSGVLAAAATTATIGTGLTLPATNGILTISYDTANAIGATDGPETISYATYNSVTGVLTGLGRGLAGTTDVEHSSGQSVQSAISSVLFNQGPDWWYANQTWAYASATTITVPSGAAAKYAVGDKIKLTQTTVKYFYVTAVANTVLTVTGGTDYTVANEAITDNYYSKASSPVGFPDIFNFTPTYTARANMTFESVTTTTGKFKINGRSVHLWVTCSGTTGGSEDRDWIGLTAPIASGIAIGGSCHVFDGSADFMPGWFDLTTASGFRIYKTSSTNFGRGVTRGFKLTVTYPI